MAIEIDQTPAPREAVIAPGAADDRATGPAIETAGLTKRYAAPVAEVFCGRTTRYLRL